jgi:hypothetical protein
MSGVPTPFIRLDAGRADIAAALITVGCFLSVGTATAALQRGSKISVQGRYHAPTALLGGLGYLTDCTILSQ